MYYLKIGRVDGVMGIDEPSIQKETKVNLSQNYPNPFRTTTTINYEVVSGSKFKLSVDNMLGKLMITIVDDFKVPRNHSVSLNANDFSDGIYYYKISSEGYSQTRRMIVMQ